MKNAQCDLPDYCTGSSEWCPEDKYKHDGTECFNREQAYCYHGRCNSCLSQCHLIWGVEDVETAYAGCYNINTRGLYNLYQSLKL